MTKAPSGAPAPSRPAREADVSRQAPTRQAERRRPATIPEPSGANPSEQPGTARIIAIANQKGGVGKSTTAVSLGAALADLGYRVLVIDLDPQGNASTGLGIRHEARATTVYDVVVADAPLTGAVVQTQVQGLDAVPATIDLAGAEIELVSQFSRESRLKVALEAVREGVYDFVLLDCPPSLGLLTVNALTAAEELIVPIQCEYYALEGLGQLLRNVNLVQQNINPGLRLSGIVMTMFDPRTKLSEQVVDEVRRFFGDIVYDVIIPRTIRLSEAPGFGQPITVYDPRSKGAATYRDLAREVALRPPPQTPMPSFDDLPSLSVNLGEEAITRRPSVDRHGPARRPERRPEPPPETAPARREPSPEGRAKPPRPPPVAFGAPGDAHEEVGATEPAPSSSVAPVEQSAVEEAPPFPPAQVPPVPPAQEPAEAEIWEDDTDDRTPEPTPAPARRERRLVVIDDVRETSPPPDQERSEEGPGAGDDQDRAIAPIGATLETEPGGRRRRWRLFRRGGG